MKKFLTLALTAVMALSLLTACGSKNDNSADTNTDGSNTETTLSGTVSTDGSTSMEKVDRKSTRLNSSHSDRYLVCRLLLEKKLFLMIRRPPRSTLFP